MKISVKYFLISIYVLLIFGCEVSHTEKLNDKYINKIVFLASQTIGSNTIEIFKENVQGDINIIVSIENVSLKKIESDYFKIHRTLRGVAINIFDYYQPKTINDIVFKLSGNFIVNSKQSEVKNNEYEIIAINFNAKELNDKNPIDSNFNINNLIGKRINQSYLDSLEILFSEIPMQSKLGEVFFLNNGLSLLSISDTILDVSLYRRGNFGANTYKGNLPHNIKFKDSIDAITDKLGKPNRFANDFRWISFDKEGLVFYFDNDRKLNKVIIKSPAGDTSAAR